MPPKKLHRPAAKTQRRAAGAFPQASWDDLRLFLRCAEHGSFRKAAREAALDSATMIRRISRLEDLMGQRLFLRAAEGLELTEEGSRILRDVLAMEEASLSIARQSRMADQSVRGLVRVAITEGLGTYWVLPRLLEFQKANRYLTIDLQVTMGQVDVGRLQADISIQFMRPSRPDLRLVQLGYLHIYPFASEGYRRLYGLPKDREELKSHRLVQHAPLLEEGAYERMLGLDSLEGVVGVRTNAASAALYAIERDAGIGFLPNYALALGADVAPVDIGVKKRFDIWMTYHADIRNSKRHVIVIDWLRRIFDPKRFPCFGGEFVHPRDLVRSMAETAAINYGGGFLAAGTTARRVLGGAPIDEDI
ncbi:MAG: LysR family transcriptional regulator [Methylocystaceae bacterium]|nr:MAG: LysR family transcriptional regulator [Methylocystaceae bacterium]